MMGEAPDPNTVIVDPREGGQKLLQFLQRRLDLPPSLLHRWIRTQGVRWGAKKNAPVLSGIQNVITDGNPAKWVGGVSKKGRGQRGFVKITRGKSDGLIRF